jgi:hypothetical protein
MVQMRDMQFAAESNKISNLCVMWERDEVVFSRRPLRRPKDRISRVRRTKGFRHKHNPSVRCFYRYITL